MRQRILANPESREAMLRLIESLGGDSDEPDEVLAEVAVVNEIAN